MKRKYAKSKYPGIYLILEQNKNGKYIQPTRGNKYRVVKWIKIDGKNKQKLKHFDNLSEAKEWKQSKNLSHVSKNNLMSFEVLVDKYFEHKSKKVQQSTIETYKSQLKCLSFFNDLSVQEISPKTVDVWLKNVKSKEVLITMHRTRLSFEKSLSLLRAIFNFYIEYLSEDNFSNPVRRRHFEDAVIDVEKYKRSKNAYKEKFLTKEQVIAFLTELKKQGKNSKEKNIYYFIALVSYVLGLRIGECMSLEVEDFCFKKKLVRISKTVQWSRRAGVKTKISSVTKGGVDRLIPITEQVELVIKEIFVCYQVKTGRIFSKDGEIVSYRSIQYAFNKAFKNLNIPFRSCHILRHSMATAFYDASRDISALKGILGHAHIAQTEQYSSVTNMAKFKASKQFDSLIKEII